MHEHTCPGRGCVRVVPHDVMACARHWGRLSAATRAAITAARRANDWDAYLLLRAAALKEMR